MDDGLDGPPSTGGLEIESQASNGSAFSIGVRLSRPLRMTRGIFFLGARSQHDAEIYESISPVANVENSILEGEVCYNRKVRDPEFLCMYRFKHRR